MVRKYRVLLIALLLSGCASPVSDTYAPVLDNAKHAVDLGVCHAVDAFRFASTGIGNVIDGSVKGFAVLAVNGGPAATSAEGLVILGVAGGVLGTGAGLVKTFEEWEPGIDDCLLSAS